MKKFDNHALTVINYDGIPVEWAIFKNGDCYNNFNKGWMYNVITKNNPIPIKEDFIKILEKRYNKIWNS